MKVPGLPVGTAPWWKSENPMIAPAPMIGQEDIERSVIRRVSASPGRGGYGSSVRGPRPDWTTEVCQAVPSKPSRFWVLM